MSYTRITYQYAGATRIAWYSLWSEPAAGRAGMARGVVTFSLDASAEDLDLPVDDQQYSYTHGGTEYQAARRAAWAHAGGAS